MEKENAQQKEIPKIRQKTHLQVFLKEGFFYLQ